MKLQGLVIGMVILFAAAMAPENALAARQSRVKGSGRVVSEVHPVAGFDRVSLGVSGDLYIKQGEKESLRIEAEDNLLPMIRITVANRSLVIDCVHDYPCHSACIKATKPIKFYLTAKNLAEITALCSGAIKSEGLNADNLSLRVLASGGINLVVQAKRLECALLGSVECLLAGSVDSQEVVIQGSGDYSARNLRSKTCKVTIRGSGSAEVAVRDELAAAIFGSGSVKYLGHPEVNKVESGSGRVLPLKR